MAQLTTDQQLQFTQGLRMQALGELTADGKLPIDEEGRAFFTKLLDGADRQALTLKRIEADNNNSQQDREVALMSAAFSAKIARNGNPFRKTNGITLSTDGQLPEIDIIDGQMDVGRSSETFREFIAKVEPEGQ